jgi:hypothetical protein
MNEKLGYVGSSEGRTFGRWSKCVVTILSVVGLLSTSGVAFAAWTNKSGSGNGAARAGTLGTPGTFAAACHSSSSRQVDFSWSTVTNAGGYTILDSSTFNGTYSQLQAVSGGGTTSANSGNNLSAGTYYFKIEATAASWIGSPSSAAGPRTIVHVMGPSYTCS